MLYRNNSVFTLCGEQHSSLCSHCESDVCYCVHTVTVTFVVAFTLWQWCSLLHSHCVESNVRRCVHTLRVTFVVLFTLCGKRRFSLCSHCDSDVRHCVHTMTVTLVVVFTCESDVRRCVHNVWRATFLVVFTLWERRSSLCSHCVESDVPACVHTMRAMFVVVFTLWEWRSSLCSHTVWRVKFLVVFTLWEWRSLFLSYTYFWKHVWLGNPGINISVSCHVHTVLPFLYIFHQYCGISETVATSSVDLCSNVTGSDRICGEASYIACWFNEAPSLPVDLMRPHTLPVDLMRPHTVPVDLMRPHTLPVAWTTSRSYCRQSHSNSPRSLLQETFVSLFLDEPKVLADEIETESIASPIVLLRVLLLCVSCAACQAEGVRRDIVECCKFRDSVIRRFTCRLVEYLWSVSDLYVAMMISMLPFIAFTFCLWLVEIHADIMR